MSAPPVAQPGTLAQRLKTRMTGAVAAWENSRPRSMQTGMGASNVGDPCLRKLAYQAAGTPKPGDGGDPWPAIVGTSCHEWVLTQAFQGSEDWELGSKMEIGPDLWGTLDLYDKVTATVIDHKVLGTDAMRFLRLHGAKPAYRVQVHCYAYGLQTLGYTVRNVAIAGWPRSGWMRDLHVWVEAFSLDVVEDAFDRWYTLKEAVPAFTPETFEALAMDATGCFFCPYKNGALAKDHPELACPGAGK